MSDKVGGDGDDSMISYVRVFTLLHVKFNNFYYFISTIHVLIVFVFHESIYVYCQLIFYVFSEVKVSYL